MSKSGLLIFRGKKKQNFAGFSGANSRKNRPISRDFSGKKVNFRRIFRGKFLEKSADFTGNFGEKVRQETISKKQPVSLNVFFNRDNHSLFQQQFTREISEC